MKRGDKVCRVVFLRTKGVPWEEEQPVIQEGIVETSGKRTYVVYNSGLGRPDGASMYDDTLDRWSISPGAAIMYAERSIMVAAVEKANLMYESLYQSNRSGR